MESVVLALLRQEEDHAVRAVRQQVLWEIASLAESPVEDPAAMEAGTQGWVSLAEADWLHRALQAAHAGTGLLEVLVD